MELLTTELTGHWKADSGWWLTTSRSYSNLKVLGIALGSWVEGTGETSIINTILLSEKANRLEACMLLIRKEQSLNRD